MKLERKQNLDLPKEILEGNPTYMDVVHRDR